ncbi:MAG: CPBP family intramembrane metalloprotease [Planctomycetaceae bacterium]|jgi:membrane protease YdiL (CAAX protease family)|nr:CPBP family intramembrane metalloprotease [Planctomycetaceae bacterium]
MKSFSRTNGIILVIAAIFPFFLTLIYFVLLTDSPVIVQRLVYGIGKIIQFTLPVFWVGVLCRERWLVRPWNARGFAEGMAFGMFIAVAMVLLYFFYLGLPEQLLGKNTPASLAIIAKMNRLGITNGQQFFLLGVFYSVIHSGLEEYYWRWFVFGRLQRGWSCFFAAIISSLGFTAHHILLLGTYFGYVSPFCWLGSLGVAVGGLYWAWLYKRSDSIWGIWISHGFIDAAIFIIGFMTCFR